MENIKYYGILVRIFLASMSVLLLSSLVCGLVFEGGVVFSVSGGGGNYTLSGVSTPDFGNVTLNSTHIVFKGLPSDTDVIFLTTGKINQTNTTTATLKAIDYNEYLVLYPFYWTSSQVEILNFTGSTSNLSVCFNTTGTGNLKLALEDLDGECNYGVFSASGYSTYTNFSETAYSNSTTYTVCNVTLYFNQSVQGASCLYVYEDEGTSSTGLATILAATAATIILLTKGYQWSSVS